MNLRTKFGESVFWFLVLLFIIFNHGEIGWLYGLIWQNISQCEILIRLFFFQVTIEIQTLIHAHRVRTDLTQYSPITCGYFLEIFGINDVTLVYVTIMISRFLLQSDKTIIFIKRIGCLLMIKSSYRR